MKKFYQCLTGMFLALISVFVVETVYAKPLPVTNLTAIPGFSKGMVNLSWVAPADDGTIGQSIIINGFEIQYSTYNQTSWTVPGSTQTISISTSSISAGSVQSYVIASDIGLTSGVTYYFWVWTRDSYGVWSSTSNTAISQTRFDTPPTIVSPSDVALEALVGNKLVIAGYTVIDTYNISGATATLKWKTPTGATFDTIASTYIPPPANPQTGINYVIQFEPIMQEAYSGTTPSKFYITVDDGQNTPVSSAERTVNVIKKLEWTNVQDEDRLYTLSDGNPNDGATSILIRSGAIKDAISKLGIEQLKSSPEFWATENTINTDLITLGNPIVVFNFTPVDEVFNKPVTITLLYPDLDNDGKTETSKGTPIVGEEKLKLYYHDGMGWRLIGGLLDAATNTIRADVTRLGTYALFAIATTLSEDLSRPKEKFVTSNIGATFGINALEVKIYDVMGNEIRILNQTDFPGGVITWYGKDLNDMPVESGAYIYKIVDNEEKSVYGTVIVAR